MKVIGFSAGSVMENVLPHEGDEESRGRKKMKITTRRKVEVP